MTQKTKSVSKVLRILSKFSHNHPVYKITSLAQELDMPKSTVSRLVQDLVRANYLMKDPNSRGYLLGNEIRRLGAVSISKTKIYHEVSPLLNRLVVETKETAQISVLQGYSIVYLGKNDSPYFSELVTKIGDYHPAYATSAGKVLLLDKSTEFIKEIFEDNPIQYTPKTITNYDHFMKELEKVRVQGYAFSLGELSEDNFSLAVPVYDESNNIVCAISVAGPLSRRANPTKEQEYIDLLLETAQEASERLSYAEEGYL